MTATSSQDASPPPPSTTSQIESDAPSLLPLHKSAPTLHIYTLSNANFATLHSMMNLAFPSQPLAVIRPVSEAEVVSAVRFCASVSIPLVIRTGGYDIGGRSSPAPDGVTLDMRSMNSATLSAGRTTATVGGGILSGGVLEFLDGHGLTTPTPWMPGVGYAAWACGGGYGLLSGVMGMGCDQILGGRVVTGLGEVRDSDDDAELLWGLRGGGAGVLGVVTELRVKAYKRPKCLAGFLIFPLAEAPTICEKLGTLFSKNRPERFAFGEAMIINPPGSGGLFTLYFSWSLKEDESDEAEAKEYVEKLSELGTLAANAVKETTPLQLAQMPEMHQGSAMIAMYKVTSRCVSGWTAELGRHLSQALPSPTSAIVIHSCHSVASKPDPKACYYNREPHVLLGISGSAPPEDTEGVRTTVGWATGLVEKLDNAGLSTGREYINFFPAGKGDASALYGQQAAKRMKKLKERYDPEWLFEKCTPDLRSV